MKKGKSIKILLVVLAIIGAQLLCNFQYVVLADDVSENKEIEGIVDSKNNEESEDPTEGNEENPTVEEKVVIDITKSTISSISNQTYTGKAITPNVTVKYENKVLVKNTDYKVKYSNNTNVGTATVTIEGMGDYKGRKTVNFKIVQQNVKNLKVNMDTTQTYTGKQIKPTVTMYNGSVKLKQNTDYTVTYKNNTKMGKATVTIKCKGNYTGTVSKTFNIVPKTSKITSVTMNTKFTKATVKWKKDSQASGYSIYMATSKNGKYTKIKNINKNSTTKYVVSNLNANKTYYFKVRAYILIDGKKVYSKSYSSAVTNTGLLASVTLKSSSSAKNRNSNLSLACKTINGYIIKPGKTFNWFNVVGEASASKGYKSATIFVNGKTAQGMGGGVCQVSTTLYQACTKINLKMVERHTHSLPVSYTTTGKDATVAYSSGKNLIIKNTKSYPIKLVMSSKGSSTTCKIYKVDY